MLSSTSQPPVVIVRVGCESVSAFIKAYARRVTQGGLFLETSELYPVGSRIAFSLLLSNGQRLLGGTGVVRWGQGPASPFDRPRLPGMGLRFAELDAESRQLVALLVATQPEGAKDPEPPGPRIAELLASGDGGLGERGGADASTPPAFSAGSGLPPELESLPPLPAVPRIAPLMDVPRIAPILEVPPGAKVARTPAPPGLTPRAGAATPAPVRRSGKTPPPVQPTAERWEASKGRASAAPRKSITSPGAPLTSVLPLPAPSSRDVLPSLALDPLPPPSPREAPLLPTPEEALLALPAPTPEPIAALTPPAALPTPELLAALPPLAAMPPLPPVVPQPPAAPAAAKPAALREALPPAPGAVVMPAAAREALPLAPGAAATPAAAPVARASATEAGAPMRPSAELPRAAVPRPSATEPPPAAPARSTEPQPAARGAPEREQGAQRVTRAIEALRRQEYAKAESELQLAVAHEPDNARYRFELGLVYFEWSDGRTQNHDGSAEACFSRAADLDSSFDQPLVYLGQVQLRRRLFKEAEAAFQEALRRQPHGRGAQEGLRVIAAMRWKQRVLRGLVAAALVILPLGGYMLRRSPAKDAPALRVAAGPPQAVPTPAPSGSIAATAPATTPAVAALVTATPAPRATAPSLPPAAAAVATAPEPSTAAPEVAAAPASEKAGTAAPKRATRRVRPPPAPREQKVAAAEAPARAPSGGGGGSAAGLVKAGDAALRAGKADEARAAFTQALQANPGFAPAHRGLGSVHMMQGNDAQAAASYRAYLKLAPNAPDAGRIQALLSGLE